MTRTRIGYLKERKAALLSALDTLGDTKLKLNEVMDALAAEVTETNVLIARERASVATIEKLETLDARNRLYEYEERHIELEEVDE